jgi:putative two-component system response regulator
MNITSEKQRILIVDDAIQNIKVLANALKNDYRVFFAQNGQEAIARANSTPAPNLILLDIMMPDMNGYDVCLKLQEDPKTKHIPIIFISALNSEQDEAKGFELGAVDYITKPYSIIAIKARVKTHLDFQLHRDKLERIVRERTKEILTSQLEIVLRLARAAEYRDNETGLHVTRMSRYCKLLAESCGIDKEKCELIFHASSLHDVGKIGIPDSILLKEARLTKDEFKLMKTHAKIGAELLDGHHSSILKKAHLIALTHHEKWDGSGYPLGTKGKNIPIEGRIAAICDVFDALTSVRPYKKAWTINEAVAELENSSGTHFDPELVNIFKNNLPEIIQIVEEFGETTS